jgi:transposase
VKNNNYPEIKFVKIDFLDSILNYFESRLTNARAEGFNNKAKLIKRRAYAYRSFENYRLRLLSACE